MATTELREGQIILPKTRLCYPKLWEAQAMKNDPTSKPRFGAELLLPKTDIKTKAKLDKEIKRLADLHFKGVIPKSKDLFIKDGDHEDFSNRPETDGHWVISANRAENQGRPKIVDKNPSVALIPSDGRPYAGCYVAALIGIFKPDNWAKITAGLEIVQFADDGERFGATVPNAEDIMPDLGPDDDAEPEAFEA